MNKILRVNMLSAKDYWGCIPNPVAENTVFDVREEELDNVHRI